MRAQSGCTRTRMNVSTSAIRIRDSRRCSSRSSSATTHGSISTLSSTASVIFRPACTVRSSTSSIFQKYGARSPAIAPYTSGSSGSRSPESTILRIASRDQPRRRRLQDLVAMPQDGVIRRLLDLETETRCELDRAHHPHGVLAETDIGIADHPHAFLPHVLEAADVVDHREIGDVVEERVDREVAPLRILKRRAERVVIRDQEIFVLFIRRASLRLAPEGRDLDDLILKDDVHQPEAPADDAAVAEETADVARMRIRRDVEVLRLPVHQQIAHAASAQIRAIAAAMQPVENLQNVFRNAAARDRVIAAIDYRRTGVVIHRCRIVR